MLFPGAKHALYYVECNVFWKNIYKYISQKVTYLCLTIYQFNEGIYCRVVVEFQLNDLARVSYLAKSGI